MLNRFSGPQKAIVLSILAFVLLYFGFSKISPEIRNPEKSAVSKNIENDFEQKAITFIDSLSDDSRSQIALFMKQYESSTVDSVRIASLKKISGFWYAQGKTGLAAEYARKVAELVATPDAWTLAATNFVLAIKQGLGTESEQKDWLSKARHGFEQAVALDSNNVVSKLNQALLAVEFPENGPMEGILALRKLNKQYPDEPAVLFHLARLAIETNQLDRAKERLSHLVKVAPDYTRAYCLLAQIAEKENNSVAFKSYSEKCKDE